eukprot:COSAG02_NODE_30287_length_554_cov_0.731868_1_plen_149_part_01
MRRGTFDELVSQACGTVPTLPQITEWIADKFGAITKAHEKELEGRKRKHDLDHQLELETQNHHIRVLTNPEVTYVGDHQRPRRRPCFSLQLWNRPPCCVHLVPQPLGPPNLKPSYSFWHVCALPPLTARGWDAPRVGRHPGTASGRGCH